MVKHVAKKVIVEQHWEASDGRVFGTEEEASAYERILVIREVLGRYFDINDDNSLISLEGVVWAVDQRFEAMMDEMHERKCLPGGYGTAEDWR